MMIHNVYQHLSYNTFSGRVLMSGVHCNGNEARLEDCYRTDANLRTSSCTHDHDVAVECGVESKEPV